METERLKTSESDFICPNCYGNEVSGRIIFRKTSERVRCASCGLEFKRYLPSGEWTKYPKIEERKGVRKMARKIELSSEEIGDILVREKTKEELEKDVRDCFKNLENARRLVEKREKKEELEEAADQTYAIYKAYIDAGFGEEQAFEIVKMMLERVFERA